MGSVDSLLRDQATEASPASLNPSLYMPARPQALSVNVAGLRALLKSPDKCRQFAAFVLAEAPDAVLIQVRWQRGEGEGGLPGGPRPPLCW